MYLTISVVVALSVGVTYGDLVHCKYYMLFILHTYQMLWILTNDQFNPIYKYNFLADGL